MGIVAGANALSEARVSVEREVCEDLTASKLRLPNYRALLICGGKLKRGAYG